MATKPRKLIDDPEVNKTEIEREFKYELTSTGQTYSAQVIKGEIWVTQTNLKETTFEGKPAVAQRFLMKEKELEKLKSFGLLRYLD